MESKLEFRGPLPQKPKRGNLKWVDGQKDKIQFLSDDEGRYSAAFNPYLNDEVFTQQQIK